MQKFITLLEKMEEGAEFPSFNWPLHVTIADTFAIDRIDSGLYEELSRIVSRHKTATGTALHDEHFGEQQQTRVTMLDMSSELIALHHDVIDLLKGRGAIFNEPQYIEGGFRAHVTVQSHARLNRSDIVKFSELTLIDMFPNEDPYQRRVIKTLR